MKQNRGDGARKILAPHANTSRLIKCVDAKYVPEREEASSMLGPVRTNARRRDAQQPDQEEALQSSFELGYPGLTSANSRQPNASPPLHAELPVHEWKA